MPNTVAKHYMTPAPGRSQLRTYEVLRPAKAIDLFLDSNEGPALPCEVLRHIAKAPMDDVRRYPNTTELERIIAHQLQLRPDQVIVTAGADDAIERCFRVMLCGGRECVIPSPTFEMFSRYALMCGGSVVEVDWRGGDSRFPIDAMTAAVTSKTSAIALATPNNPTGAVASGTDLERMSNAAPRALLILDLAYIEFADEDLTSLALRLPNAIVVRTFSKAYGLAGLRVGYAAGPHEVIGWLRNAGHPFPVSSMSLSIAAQALVGYRREVDGYVAAVRSEREQLASVLAALGAAPLRSQGNFVLAGFLNADYVWQGLAERGIAVRRFLNHPELSSHLRITCPGEPAAFERLCCALHAVMTGDGS